MRAEPLVVNFHNENAPIYSAHFDPHGKGRLATAGGDNNIRLWRVEATGEKRRVIYLATLIKHTQAVNVVRFCPKGEMLASAGDDGNVLLWVPSEMQGLTPAMAEEPTDDKETWRIKHMCRSSGSEIYDLAWSPDGVFIITGSMDNVARIYNAQTGQAVRQIAEHNHYVQGVAWDPLNEFVATQSSDRAVHIYTLKSKDGHFSLAQHGKFAKMDLPSRRISSNSPAPPDFGPRPHFVSDASSLAIASPTPSAPGTPMSFPLPMNPPALTPSRRSSFSSSPSMRRSVSPAPSLPLPAVKPMESSPKVHQAMGVRNANMYANETLASFFRRLTFAPDGSLLFTPAGQYKVSQPTALDPARNADDTINTVYIYTRAGFHKPPIAHLPGHKKPSIAVRCSPIFYTLRSSLPATKHITLDTSSGEDSLSALPDPAIPSRAAASASTMDPPQSVTAVQPPGAEKLGQTPSRSESGNGAATPGPTPAFALPYRIVYAVATQDAVLVYDTQQTTPLCIVSNLHFATFTDLTWAMDGLTLLMSSSDGFCSTLTFAPGELGQVYTGPVPTAKSHSHLTHAAASSSQSTPTPTPPSIHPPSVSRPPSNPNPPSASPLATIRPFSPTRSNSASSVATQMSLAQTPASEAVTINPAPVLSTLPSIAAAQAGSIGTVPLATPPQTPMSGNVIVVSTDAAPAVLGKRDTGPATGSDPETRETVKRRRIAPTLVTTEEEAKQA